MYSRVIFRSALYKSELRQIVISVCVHAFEQVIGFIRLALAAPRPIVRKVIVVKNNKNLGIKNPLYETLKA